MPNRSFRHVRGRSGNWRSTNVKIARRWRLYSRGFRCVAFVHVEVLIELPIDGDHTRQAEKINQILCDSMGQLTGTILIDCESMVETRRSCF